jgi:hypothetical protein
MSTLNQFSCLQINVNTGIGACPINPKNIIGAILTPKKYQVTTATLAAFQAALIADAANASKAARIYPIYDFRPLGDNSEALVVQTFSTGQKAPVREGVYDWQYQFVAGGIDLLKKLRLNNEASTSHDFFLIDSQNLVIGMAAKDGSNDVLQAIPSDGGFIWFLPWKQNDGSKVAEYAVQFVFLPKYINELLGYVKANFDLQTSVFGLQDVALTSPSANVTAGSYNVAATIVNGGTNMADQYQTELANGAVWVAKNTQTGAAITVTGVTYNAGGYFVVALNTADPDYPAGGGDKVTISLAAPTVLAANGLEGYESNSVDIVHN